MARVNAKKSGGDYRLDHETHLAGGMGAPAAKQGAEQSLRRVVLANLLWEDVAYENGVSVAARIQELVPQVAPEVVAEIAIEARTEQRLRHVPLLIARECARHRSHQRVVEGLLPRIILRPDELAEFVALYWMDGKEPLAASAKKGLAASFTRFDAYQLAKWNQNREIKLRDVMFLVHPEPKDAAQAEVFKQLANNSLPTPDTWEVALSSGADKKATWERLIDEGKLGALAFMRNLRNMEQASVSSNVIRHGFDTLRTDWLLPLNFFGAAKAAPRWQAEIEEAMFRSLEQMPKLSGLTHLVVDVSGSMGCQISHKSIFTRLEAAAAMAVLAREMCEHVIVWATAGNDSTRKHKTTMLKPHRGFALAESVVKAQSTVGWGGIYTRQCLEYIKDHTDDYGARTIVFSDSQDCERPFGRAIPQTFSPRNYIVDVSAHQHGVAYDGVWDAEVSGWSEHFLPYIHALETSSQ